MYVTLFYSAYSANSKALLQIIKNLKLNFTIKFINIDNGQIKKLVLQKFSVVPTLVVLDGDELSLYTGANAFDWFAQLDESHLNAQGGARSLRDESVPDPESTKPQASKPAVKSLLDIAAELAKERDIRYPEPNPGGFGRSLPKGHPAKKNQKNQKNEIDLKKNL